MTTNDLPTQTEAEPRRDDELKPPNERLVSQHLVSSGGTYDVQTERQGERSESPAPTHEFVASRMPTQLCVFGSDAHALCGQPRFAPVHTEAPEPQPHFDSRRIIPEKWLSDVKFFDHIQGVSGVCTWQCAVCFQKWDSNAKLPCPRCRPNWKGELAAINTKLPEGVSDPPLTDAEVDAFLEEHKDDPVDEQSANRIEWLFRENLAADARSAIREWIEEYNRQSNESGLKTARYLEQLYGGTKSLLESSARVIETLAIKPAAVRVPAAQPPGPYFTPRNVVLLLYKIADRAWHHVDSLYGVKLADELHGLVTAFAKEIEKQANLPAAQGDVVDKENGIPEGAKPVDAYLMPSGQIVVCGEPPDEPEDLTPGEYAAYYETSHNCDQVGCGLSHVLFRFDTAAQGVDRAAVLERPKII